MNPSSSPIATLIAALFVLFAIPAATAADDGHHIRRLLKGSAVNNWEKRQQHHQRRLPKQPKCGNNVVEDTEECDGSDVTGCTASETCVGCVCTAPPAVCGDGTHDATEECDDGNTNSGDGCSSTCTEEVCGNSNIDYGEECDDGNTDNNDGCSSSCIIEAGCGNGYKDSTEECDDGNTISGDGCSSTCTSETVCGNGVVEGAEECDGVGTCPFSGYYCHSDCTCQLEADCPNSMANGAGPQIAMAWVSDMWANFDMEHDMTVDCTTPGDPSNPLASNQFKCCHDWLLNDGGTNWAGINTVSLSFAKPTEILDPASCYDATLNEDRCDSLGVRKGIPGAITYFKDTLGMSLVFISVGGATYREDWEAALASDAAGFGEKCAAIANHYGVGIEIDYEGSTDPYLTELEAFIIGYRTYADPNFGNQVLTAYNDGAVTDPLPQSFLTIDLGQGAQFMGDMANWVAQNAFGSDHTKRLNWANAMVGGSRQSSPSTIIANWEQHLLGYSTLQMMPIAPSNLVVSVWSSGRRTQANCIGDGPTTLEDTTVIDFITNAEPCIELCGQCTNSHNVGPLPPIPAGSTVEYTKGLLGYAYWMVGNIGSRTVITCPTDVVLDIYGVTYEGDGDCTVGFTNSVSEYPTIPSAYDLADLRKEYGG